MCLNICRYIVWVWPIFASFSPCGILIISNVALIRQLRVANKVRRITAPTSSTSLTSIHITLTLVLICLSHVVLVTPAEAFKYVIPLMKWDREMTQFIGSIANIMQVGIIIGITEKFNGDRVKKCLVIITFFVIGLDYIGDQEIYPGSPAQLFMSQFQQLL